MDKLLGERRKASLSIHRRRSLPLIEEQHGITTVRRNFSPSSQQMERVPSDLDPVNELVELAEVHAESPVFVNAGVDLGPLATLYHRYLGVCPLQNSLKRILSRSARRQPLPSPTTPTTSPTPTSPLIACGPRRQTCPRQRLTTEITRPLAIAFPLPPNLVPSPFLTPAPASVYISAHLHRPPLIPIPHSPRDIPASNSSTFEISSTPPSLSSSLTLTVSTPPSPITPSSPVIHNFAAPLLRRGEHAIRQNRFDRAAGEVMKFA